MRIDKKAFVAGLVGGIIAPTAVSADFVQYQRFFSSISNTRTVANQYDDTKQLAEDFLSVGKDLTNAMDSYVYIQKR